MRFFSESPFLRILLPFALGIVFGFYYPQGNATVTFFIVSCCIFTLVFSLIKNYDVRYKFSWVQGFFINGILFFAGLYILQLNTVKDHPTHYTTVAKKYDWLSATITDIPKENDKSIRCFVKLNAVKTANEWVSVSGNVLLYLQKDSLAERLHYGDVLIVKNQLKPLASAVNPAQFNYAQYLSYHGIYEQAYYKSGAWKKMDTPENTFLRRVYAIRHSLLTILSKALSNENEYSVAAALLVGYDDAINQDLMRAYASSGALHVLSVSGLHVGIIFLFFNYIFSFFTKLRYGVIFKTIALLLILWGYALLTGFSPSVLRATAMFSFIVIAKGINKNSNIFNALALSCFILLLVQPFLLFEVGFQLSYLAVLGIVTVHPWLSKQYTPPNWLLKQIWQLTSVSLAAQLTTFPLGLLYFHQFSNYFIFSNLVVIPLSTIVLYVGILFLCFNSIAVVASPLLFILKKLIAILNGSVQLFEQLPFSVTNGIWISTWETWLIYVGIVLIVIFIASTKKWSLFSSLIVFTFLLVFNVVESINQHKQQFTIIYAVPKHTAITMANGTSAFLISDSLFLLDKRKQLFFVQHHWWQSGLTVINKKNESNCFIDNTNAVYIDKEYLYLNGTLIYKPYKKIKKQQLATKPDILLITNKNYIPIDTLVHYFPKSKFVFDASISYSRVKNYIDNVNLLKTSNFSTAETGAYLIEHH